MDFSDHIQASLHALERSGLLRAPRLVSSDQGPEITIDGRRAISLCSNNYLGLANHPALTQAAQTALAQTGFGAGASRHVSGSHSLHRQLEQRLADFTQSPAALLFSSGYAANVGSVQALVGRGDVVFSDALNHASLIDGCALSRATVHVYRHRDVEHLAALLRNHRGQGRAALIVTDAAFSMDGDLAPVADLQRLARQHGAGLLVDEAHTFGVFGPDGRGLCAAEGVAPDVLIGTLGKSVGASGAFAAGPGDVVSLIQNRARSYVFSTAPSPSAAAAALAGLQLLIDGDALRERVHTVAAMLRQGLSDLGLQPLPGPLPILPVPVGDANRTMRISAALLEAGCFVHGIRPPTVPQGQSRLRVTCMASHTDAHVQRALEAFAGVRKLFDV